MGGGSGGGGGWMSLRSHRNTLPEGGRDPLLELTQSLSQR